MTDAPCPLNPERALLTGLVGFDKTIVRGSGVLLYDADGREYLDFSSQYGALPFGHNPEFLWDRIAEVRDSQGPSFVQPMRAPAAEELARRLLAIAPAGLDHVVFTTSGAECVEAAIKLTRARTQRRTILATEHGFHGKTLGAASATGTPVYREPFLVDTTAFEHVPYDDLRRLEDRLACGDVAAFVVEPVQGEGGMVVPRRGYLQGARRLCHEHGALFVLDEVQTGLGRTGKMFAAEWDEVHPDVLLTAKALGGGLVPLGACLVASRAWSKDFGRHHSSTFANNHFTCSVGLATIERLARDGGALLLHARAMGDRLRRRLEELVVAYPKAFRSVSGKGLMQGLRLAPWPAEDSYVLGRVAGMGQAVALLSGFLLNVHRVVTLPTLTASNVLRIQPPLTIESQHVDRLVGALASAGDLIQRGMFLELLEYVVRDVHAPPPLAEQGTEPATEAGDPEPPPTVRVRPSDGHHLGTFAFLMHPTRSGDLMDCLPSGWERYPEDERRALGTWIERWRRFDPSPQAFYHLPHLASKAGGFVDGWLIGALLMPGEMLRLGPTEKKKLMEQYFAVARQCGATMVGLGGFTSVITRGATEVPESDLYRTTGNSLTALACARGLRRVVREAGRSLRACTVAIVGAAGSTGRLVALDLAPHCGRMVLLGNPTSPGAPDALEAVAKEVRARLREPDDVGSGRVRVSTSAASELAVADVVVSATSSGQAFIRPEWLARRAIVCDVARPADVCSEVAEMRPDVIVYEGGLVTLPSPVRFGRNNVIGFPAGVSLGCLCETIVLAMSRTRSHCSLGTHVPYEEAEEVFRLATLHGFEPHAPLLSRRSGIYPSEVDPEMHGRDAAEADA